MKPYAYRASEEMRMKAELSRKEAESLVERELRCPECGFKAGWSFPTVPDILPSGAANAKRSRC